MGVNSLPKTVTLQRLDCDLNPGPSAPESSTLTTRLPSHPTDIVSHIHMVLLVIFIEIDFSRIYPVLLNVFGSMKGLLLRSLNK